MFNEESRPVFMLQNGDKMNNLFAALSSLIFDYNKLRKY